MQSDPRSIWVLTDGRAGNEAQALGLAEALARRRPARIEVKRLAPKRWAAALPARVWHGLGARAGGWPFTGYQGAVAPPWPDLAIGAGRRIAPLVAALRRLHGIGAVQVMDPRMPAAAFDLVVAPQHDRLTAPNALATLGTIGRVTAQRVEEEAARWRRRLAHLPPRRTACLIGGPSPSAFWREEDIDRLVAELAALSRAGFGLLITASRRSDPVVLAGLRADCDPAATFLWDGSGENPYPGILGLAEAVLVTEDSVNMASEAASTGLPLHVFRISGTAPKLRAFHAALAERGIARDYGGTIEAWRYQPLAEADRVAAEVEKRLWMRVDSGGGLG
ncbi:MAG TPA: mitochondrial fission ELM1 family protein [Thermohalobaculum sp.]|nr:mitochondrial fission ELM1 family protein [Thermohalobaculum sp.]